MVADATLFAGTLVTRCQQVAPAEGCWTVCISTGEVMLEMTLAGRRARTRWTWDFLRNLRSLSRLEREATIAVDALWAKVTPPAPVSR